MKRFIALTVAALLTLLAAPGTAWAGAARRHHLLVVSQDGRPGTFGSVQAALDAVQPGSGPATILIEPGTYLGRPWQHTGVTSPVGQITIRGTYLPAAINPEQWQNWSSPPFPWQDARFYEYQNTGPGSAVNAAVPQLTAAQAAQYTVASYLGGWWPK